ncbi:MAG TPA: peptide-methionine (S)-S-oxide reductase MsrA [Bryobacteraceae bacterium]|nr:peptide-methionine (S)-S-oxide reductase MsrA [Bryobacteraceae bacterium]
MKKLLSFCLVAACAPAGKIPAPATDVAANGSKTATAVFAGGCFWGVEAVFERLKGVSKAVSGFAGGERKTAHYDLVSEGNTGHAESVEVTYDPSQISYGQLLHVFFSVAHDPTELNRQGPDEGTQYRSGIFYANNEQKRVAEAYIKQLHEARVFRRRIVTQVARLNGFYAAEANHQHFFDRNPNYPYIVYNDLPKVRELEKLFPDLVAKRLTGKL